jgi:hypothetical protein
MKNSVLAGTIGTHQHSDVGTVLVGAIATH